LERGLVQRLPVSRGMGAPRFVPPGSLVELTFRTNAAKFYLRPSPALNAAILGILARALTLYPVTLHAFVFLSNHWHALLTPCDGEALASFKQHVHSNIAKAVQEIHGIQGKIWAPSGSKDIQVLDDDAQLKRLKYLLSHGTKEGLVTSPLLWPGVTAARALVGDEKLVGYWKDKRRLRELLKKSKGKMPAASKYMLRIRIKLAPLPVHRKLALRERQRQIRAMIAEIEAEYPGPKLGVQAVLDQDPNGAPAMPKKAHAPAVHTTSTDLYDRFLVLRAAFRSSYRKSADEHRASPTVVTWHDGVHLPGLQFQAKYRSTGRLCRRKLVDPPPTLLAQLANYGPRPK
jgi:hypothetical protein